MACHSWVLFSPALLLHWALSDDLVDGSEEVWGRVVAVTGIPLRELPSRPRQLQHQGRPTWVVRNK